MRLLLLLLMLSLGVFSCGKKPCAELAERACEIAPGTRACERATRLTASDECADYLKDVARYVELTNTTFSEPGVKPPQKVETAPASEGQAQ